mgnify:CR=1 FL=1|tara:strand:+ start:809 stop:1063 length:255 start_codon:yes stop_codon:yes gene_type:complete
MKFFRTSYAYRNGITDCKTTYRTVHKVKRHRYGMEYMFTEKDETGGWRVGFCDELQKNREWAWSVDSKQAAVEMVNKNGGGALI